MMKEDDDLSLFERLKQGHNGYLRVVAPMVRYSKLPFRLLCRKYNVDLCHTPMIMADAFIQSQESRDIEFRSNPMDRPLIAQFATNNPIELLKATQLVEDHVDGVDLNCGCPQKWVIKEALGASLIDRPNLVKEMVHHCKHNVARNLNVSIKIRIHDDIRKTVDLVKHAEAAGVDWITVHGRTIRERRAQPVHWNDIKIIKEEANVPIFYNGDVFTLNDAEIAVERTHVDGIMSARGILNNPALFMMKKPPIKLLNEYMKLAIDYGGKFVVHRYHLVTMMSSMHDYFTKADCMIMQNKRTLMSVMSFLRDYHVAE